MKKEEFLEKNKDIKGKMGNYSVEVDKETFGDWILGCFFDVNESVWKVFVNQDRGSHDIRYVSNNEDDAFDYLFSLLNVYVKKHECYLRWLNKHSNNVKR